MIYETRGRYQLPKSFRKRCTDQKRASIANHCLAGMRNSQAKFPTNTVMRPDTDQSLAKDSLKDLFFACCQGASDRSSLLIVSQDRPRTGFGNVIAMGEMFSAS